MKKALFVSLMLYCISCLLISASYAQEKDTKAIAEQLCSELENRGIHTSEDLKQIKRSLKDMLDRGATKKGLKRTLTDLSKRGVKGKYLKSTVYSMDDLIKAGEGPKEAGNIVSRAAHQAHREGLKGRDLADRVHEAIRQRRQERRQLKLQKKQQKRQLKEETEEIKGKPGQRGYQRMRTKGQKGKTKSGK